MKNWNFIKQVKNMFLWIVGCSDKQIEKGVNQKHCKTRTIEECGYEDNIDKIIFIDSKYQIFCEQYRLREAGMAFACEIYCKKRICTIKECKYFKPNL